MEAVNIVILKIKKDSTLHYSARSQHIQHSLNINLINSRSLKDSNKHAIPTKMSVFFFNKINEATIYVKLWHIYYPMEFKKN